MKLIIEEDYESMSHTAANIFLKRLKNFEENKTLTGKKHFVVGLPTGKIVYYN